MALNCFWWVRFVRRRRRGVAGAAEDAGWRGAKAQFEFCRICSKSGGRKRLKRCFEKGLELWRFCTGAVRGCGGEEWENKRREKARVWRTERNENIRPPILVPRTTVNADSQQAIRFSDEFVR